MRNEDVGYPDYWDDLFPDDPEDLPVPHRRVVDREEVAEEVA